MSSLATLSERFPKSFLRLVLLVLVSFRVRKRFSFWAGSWNRCWMKRMARMMMKETMVIMAWLAPKPSPRVIERNR